MNAQFLLGDNRQVLKSIKSNSVDVCITSPPYWKQRNYHHENQLGQEETIHDYISNLLEVFREVKRVLKRTGSLFVVIGDSHNPKTKGLNLVPQRFVTAMEDIDTWIARTPIIWEKDNPFPQSITNRWLINYEFVYHFVRNNQNIYYANPKKKIVQYRKMKGKQIEDLDYYWREIFIERDHLELFIEKITNNPNFRVEYGGKTDGSLDVRIYKKFSYWIPFDYYFDMKLEPLANSTIKEIKEGYNGHARKDYESEGIADPSKTKSNIIKTKIKFGGLKHEGYGNNTYSGNEWEMNLKGRIPRAVWRINTQGFSDSHFATYPLELVNKILDSTAPQEVCTGCKLPTHNIEGERCYCNCEASFERSLVLDPFLGSGTTALACKFRNHNFIGIDVNQEYIDIAKKRMEEIDKLAFFR